MIFYITSILLVSTRVQLVASAATLTLPTSANCGDPAVLTCTSSGCTSGYRFQRNGVIIYNHLGPPLGISDPDRYSATVKSDSQVQLTITNIQFSDSAEYACTCGVNTITTGQTLVYQCKASTSSASVTSDKKLSITVDRLYPEPSSIVTTNTTNTLQGGKMCWPSSTLASHFRCSWDSTTSFPDGIHSYTITVITVTQAAPVFGSFRIVTPTSPTISNLSTISNIRQVLRGVQDTPLTIKCVSSGGIPAPTLAWYRGNTSTLAQSTTTDSVQQSDGTYTVTLIYKFTPGRRDDMTTFLCRVFYPGATTGASPDPSPASAILYLDRPPEAPTILGNFSITSGQVMLTVLPGFHGGYNQTLVVQISTDLTTWINNTSVYIGLDNRATDAILASLRENTLHYVRVLAYNTEGGSNNYSTVMHFTTAKDVSASPPSTALIWASIGTTCALMVVAVLVVVVLKSKKVGLGCIKPRDKSPNIYESTAAANDSAHVYSQLHKPVDISDVQHRSNDTNLYERPNALTSPEHVYSVLSAPVKEDMYVNLRV